MSVGCGCYLYLVEFCCNWLLGRMLLKWVLFLSYKTWAENSSSCCSISVGPITLTVDPQNKSIWIIFYPAATAPKRAVILYSGTWRLKSLLQLEVSDFLTCPPAEQSKAQVQRSFDVHVASLFHQSRVVKYSNTKAEVTVGKQGKNVSP